MINQKIENLKDEISSIGLSKKYPFRHKDYSLHLCIPCNDFSKWIINRLEEKDFTSIKLLIYEIIKDAQLLGIGYEGDWKEGDPIEYNVYYRNSCRIVNSVLEYQLENFIESDKNLLNEFKCFFILTNDDLVWWAKSYIYSPNNYADKFNRMIDAFCCYELKFNFKNIINYLPKANEIYLQYINELKGRGVTPGLISFEDLQIDLSLVKDNFIAEHLRKKSIGYRLHFWDLINSSRIYFDTRINIRPKFNAWYRTNEFGCDEQRNINEFINFKILQLLDIPKIIVKLFSKGELFELSEKFGLKNKNNHTKKDLENLLLENSNVHTRLIEIARNKNLYKFNPLIESDLKRIFSYKENLKKNFLLLTLISFGKPYRPYINIKKDGKYYIFYEDTNETEEFKF